MRAAQPLELLVLQHAEQLGQQIERDGRAIDLDERPATARAEVVNRPRNQLFAGAGLAFNEHRRLRGRDSLDLLEHRLQRRTRTDDLLEPALVRLPIATAAFLEQIRHKNSVGHRLPGSRFNAARRLSRRSSSSNGLVRNSTAPARNACIRIRASPWAVMKIVGILMASALSRAWSSSPDIPGMRMSAMRQAACRCSSEPRNSSADPNARALNPASFNRPCRALRIKSSSSMMATKEASRCVVMGVRVLRAERGLAIIPSYEPPPRASRPFGRVRQATRPAFSASRVRAGSSR